MTHTMNPDAPVPDDTEAVRQYLTFFLGEEVYAMEISAVREIIQYASMTTVPLMPDCVRGVINLRGAVVPVVDLKVRFERGRSEVGKKTCIVILDIRNDEERVELGLMVDAVSEVVELADREVEDPPPFGGVIRRQHMRGVGKINGRFVPIVNPDRALSIDEMTQLT